MRRCGPMMFGSSEYLQLVYYNFTLIDSKTLKHYVHKGKNGQGEIKVFGVLVRTTMLNLE